MRGLKMVFAALVLMLLSGVAMAQENVKYRLLLQVSEDSVERLMMTLNTAKFVQKEFGAPNVDVQIVVYGPGVQTLKYYAPIPVADRVREAKYEGIRIVACDHSMRAAKLKPANMLKEISYVPSGVVEIMQRSAEGWIYVRP